MSNNALEDLETTHKIKNSAHIEPYDPLAAAIADTDDPQRLADLLDMVFYFPKAIESFTWPAEPRNEP